MSEVVLILYPIVLLAYLMLAARWQPKGSPQRADPQHDRADDRPMRRMHAR
jgi:cytochrome c-type biogenesis protein CcmH/NrfG